MNQTQIVMSVFEKPLSKLKFVCTETDNRGYYVFTNSSNDCKIELNRGPRKYFRIMYSTKDYYFGLDSFDPKYKLQSDIYYSTTADLKKALQYYLEATIEYALPLIERLPKPVPQITQEMVTQLARNTKERARCWEKRHNATLAVTDTCISLLQAQLDGLRDNDYSKTHFDELSDEIINASAYLGELILTGKSRPHWDWKDDRYLLVFDNGHCFDTLNTVLGYWLYTPEFSDYTFTMQLEYLKRRLGVEEL
jgi:hypothetical protein